MRRPRDYAADLKALNDKARQLQQRRVRELGELVIATGASTLPIEHLAGALLTATRTTDLVTKEEWRTRGEQFFQGARRETSKGNRRNSRQAAQGARGAASSPDAAGSP